MHRYIQNDLSNGIPDAGLEAAPKGKLNVGFEWAP